MPSRFSFRALTLFGFPVHVHLLLPVVALYFVLTTPEYTRSEVLLQVLAFLAILVLSTLGHELGHAFVARRNRLRVHGIELWPLGGLTYHDRERFPATQLRVAMAGVAVNLAVAAAAGLAVTVRDGALPPLPRLAAREDLLLTVWDLNLALMLLNLLPGIPFDGGHALEALLWKRFGHPTARWVVLSTGLLVGMGLLLGGVLSGDAWLGVVGFWALSSVTTSYREFREHGLEDDAFLGAYDFSEGYTSLEASRGPPSKEERRAEKERGKGRRSEEKRAAAERKEAETTQQRLDRLLDRIASEGISSLSTDERAFLVEESRRLRARQRGRSPTRP